MNTLLSDLSEDELITRLHEIITQSHGQAVGIGDDCAVLADGTLLKTDCIVEGRHYLAETPPEKVGYKALARVFSDFAAMGGAPSSILVTIGVRNTTILSYIESIYRGMNALAVKHGARIVGGETVSLPDGAPQFFSLSGTAKCHEKPVLRSTAKIGDGIYVTGQLGGSFPSEHHLTFTPRLQEAEWLVKHAPPSAMMDISDGLAKDLPRLAKASNVGYNLTLADIPIRSGYLVENALQDGEDYELLFTIPHEKEKLLIDAPYKFTKIGTISRVTRLPLEGGWDHLKVSTE